MSHPAAIGLVAGVGAISLGLSLLAFAAWRRSDDARLLFVCGAFAAMFTKSAITAFSLQTDIIGHESLEMLGAAFDLVIVTLLVLPFLRR